MNKKRYISPETIAIVCDHHQSLLLGSPGYGGGGGGGSTDAPGLPDVPENPLDMMPNLLPDAPFPPGF